MSWAPMGISTPTPHPLGSRHSPGTGCGFSTPHHNSEGRVNRGRERDGKNVRGLECQGHWEWSRPGVTEGFEAGQERCSMRCFKKTLTHSDGPDFKLVKWLPGVSLNVSPNFLFPCPFTLDEGAPRAQEGSASSTIHRTLAAASLWKLGPRNLGTQC